jgi:rhodanese-related sulfurtransferase
MNENGIPMVSRDGRALSRVAKGLKFIRKEVLVQAIEAGTHRLIHLDMRRPYEYEGGHIKAAVSIDWRSEDRQRRLRGALVSALRGGGTVSERGDDSIIVVIYCEFGGKRSPQAAAEAAKALAELSSRRSSGGGGGSSSSSSSSSSKNGELHAITVVVLHGGYKQFYEEYPGLCDGGYVPE